MAATGYDDNSLLGTLDPIDLLFELGDLLLSLVQGTRCIRNRLIQPAHQAEERPLVRAAPSATAL
jgi:hypothetical protein